MDKAVFANQPVLRVHVADVRDVSGERAALDAGDGRGPERLVPEDGDTPTPILTRPILGPGPKTGPAKIGAGVFPLPSVL